MNRKLRCVQKQNMEREKRSSKLLGSKLSAIFALESPTRSHHGETQAQSVEHGFNVNHNAQNKTNTEIANTSNFTRPISGTKFPQSLKDEASVPTSSSHTTLESPKKTASTRKLSRKPPPPDDYLAGKQNARSTQKAALGNLSRPQQHMQSPTKSNRVNMDDMDEIITALEDEIKEMNKPELRTPPIKSPLKTAMTTHIEDKDDTVKPNDSDSFAISQKDPTNYSLNELDYPREDEFSNKTNCKIPHLNFQTEVYQGTEQSMSSFTNGSSSSEYLPNTKSLPPLQSPLQSVPSNKESSATIHLNNLHDTWSHSSLALAPPQTSLESFQFMDTMENIPNENQRGSDSSTSSIRCDRSKPTESQISISLPQRLEIFDFIKTPELSSGQERSNYPNHPSLRQAQNITTSAQHTKYKAEQSTNEYDTLYMSRPNMENLLPQTRATSLHQPKNAPKNSISNDILSSRGFGSPSSSATFHRKSLSMSSIFSSNSNRHINLATLKKSITLRPGEGERSNYVQTVRRNAGTAYNDLGQESWKLPVGILPTDKRVLLPTNDRYTRMRGSRKNQSSVVGLKHGHLAPRLLAAEVDESEGLNKFGLLGRSNTFQKSEKTISSESLLKLGIQSASISRGNSLHQSSRATSRTASIAESALSIGTPSLVPSTPKRSQFGTQTNLSRQALISSRVSVGSLIEPKLSEGYYQHPGYNLDEEAEFAEDYSHSTEGTMNNDDDDASIEKPRLFLANPDSASSDNE